MYADDLVLCGRLEEDLRAMVGCFAEVCRRRGLKVNDLDKVICKMYYKDKLKQR